jgi:DNA-binding NtrC family response regulator
MKNFINNCDILVVEDNETMRMGIVETLRREKYQIFAFDNGIDALKKFKAAHTPMAIVDLKMEPIDGLEVLKQIKEINKKTEVLIISAYGTVETAVKSVQMGAADFLTKPFSPDELRIRVKMILNTIQGEKKVENLLEQNRLLNEELFSAYKEIIGESSAIRKIFKFVEQVAHRESIVLIQGESGTGKELIARVIHQKSKRSEKPFIKVNCGILNDNLLESELFGHEKGAFTGAIRQKKGRFELADQGTIFLDEIGDISPAMQIKLLRVLQEGEFERVGGETTIKSDVRVISATNRDLKKMIMEEKFREDLFYRLSVIPIHLPPLRERKEDIPILVNHFLEKFAQKNREPVKSISDDGIELLLHYSWPGNIRELENLIERLVVISTNKEIEPLLIGQHVSNQLNRSGEDKKLSLEESVNAYEKNLIMQAMKKANGIKNRAAKYLGVSTSVLYYKLEKYGLI